MFEKRFRQRLALQRRAGLLRCPLPVSRRDGKWIYVNDRPILNFSSNDYLALGNSEVLRQKTALNFQRFGSSASASRLVSGNFDTVSRAEAAYARYFGYEATLFYPSGYQANLGVISTLFEKGDVLFYDKHIHASSVKGMTMSGAAFYGYNHNHISHLGRRMDKFSDGGKAVLTESLFSMDGDCLDQAGLLALKRTHGFLTMVDEAHAYGAVGPKGRGLAREVADVAVGTFGKAFGLFGAFVLLPAVMREYLINFSSPIIYTTSLPEAHGATALDILEIIEQSDERRAYLAQISRETKSRLTAEGFSVNGDAHILALRIGNEEKAVAVSQSLLDQGIYAFCARYPTVPTGKAILRLGLTAAHDETDINHLVEALRLALNVNESGNHGQ